MMKKKQKRSTKKLTIHQGQVQIIKTQSMEEKHKLLE